MISLFSTSKTILLISDDALFIYTSASSGVRFISSVPWESEEFEKDVARIIIKDCKKKPVLIVNDMVEQHYRKERVIKSGIGMMDRASLLQRKLKFAFPNYPIRASIALKEKVVSAKGELDADVFIFAAIPNSDQFRMTLEAVNKSFASILGVCLLPVESSDMSKILSDKIEASKAEKSKWVVFLSQHQSGGLRQIVTKDGEIALTRMTPVSASQEDPANWAAEVRAEFNATMSYVSRFGYQPEDGLNVLAVAEMPAASAFSELVGDAFECTAISPEDAARRLGLPVGREGAEGYGDILHVGWLAKKRKLTLPLKSPIISRVSYPRKTALAASILMFLTACFFLYISIGAWLSVSELTQNYDNKSTVFSGLQAAHKEEVDKKEALGIDIQLVQKSVKIYDVFDYKKIDSLAFMKSLGGALGNGMRVDGVQIETAKSEKTLANYVANLDVIRQGPAWEYIAQLQMTYPNTADIDAGNAEVQALKARLESLMPGNEVTILKNLGDYEYVSEVEVKSGDNVEDVGVDQDFIVEIEVKGRAKE